MHCLLILSCAVVIWVPSSVYGVNVSYLHVVHWARKKCNERMAISILCVKIDWEVTFGLINLQHYRRGWNNQFACYDPVSNSWSWPEYKGFAPTPRAAHGAAKVGDRVFIFGGRHDTLRLNDLYVLDLRLMEWNGPLKVTDPSPEGRSWHSFTGISSDTAILYGGFSRDNEPLADCWMLSAPRNGPVKWSKVQLSFNKPRLWHTAVYTNLGDVLIFGGGVTNILNTELRDVSIRIMGRWASGCISLSDLIF